MLGSKADVPVFAPQIAQFEATIPSPHALPRAGLISDDTSLLAAFSTEFQPNIDQKLAKNWPKFSRILTSIRR